MDTKAIVTAAAILAAAVLPSSGAAATPDDVERRIDDLLARMTPAEKVGQMSLRGFSSRSQDDPRTLEDAVREGRVGAFLNVMDKDAVDRLQHVAVHESRLGIPLLFGRDVIHGFRTIFPIPLGQAAAWSPELAERAARISAEEASTHGVRWTFAPMLDVARDARWGRIAESPGEDPYLASLLAAAMVRGFQGEDLSAPTSLAACAKHYAGYGAAEGGRDYDTAYLPEPLLRNVYLRPFAAAAEAGVASFMSAFNEVNGVPATAHPFLLRTVLRDEWRAEGFVVSDWNSIVEMIALGYSADARHAAAQAAGAGVDMEMTSQAYEEHLAELVDAGEVPLAAVDDAVRRVLRAKLRLGLFERPQRDAGRDGVVLSAPFLEAAREAARQSVVLLENDGGLLPLAADVGRVAVIGPLADAPHEQLGTWTFDGRKEDAVTPRAALEEKLGDRMTFAPGLATSRTRTREGFAAARAAAADADVVLFFGGEEAILSGEAHSRADLRLPGAQEALIAELAAMAPSGGIGGGGTGKPIVLVILAGRPITIADVLPNVDAVLMAWHGGTMGGPALVDLLFGAYSPSGRLPVTWPKAAGQIPTYYNHKNTGRPASDDKIVLIDDIPVEAWQSSLANTSHYLDLGRRPQYPFGYGLTYTSFDYRELEVTPKEVPMGGEVEVSATVANRGLREGTEVVQLYVRDLVGSLTRPVRELKGFERVTLAPGEERRVRFRLSTDDLAFYNGDGELVTEPGAFRVWIGWNAEAGLEDGFEVRGP